MKRLLVILLSVIFCFVLSCSVFADHPSSPYVSIKSMESFLSLIESEDKAGMLYTLHRETSDGMRGFDDSDRELLAEKIERLQKEGFFATEIEEKPKTVQLYYSTRGSVNYTYNFGGDDGNPLRGLLVQIVHFDPQVRNKLKNTEELFQLVFGAVYNFELDKERPYELRINGTPCTAYYLKKPETTVVAEYEGFMIELINVGSVEKYAESFDLSFSGEIRPAFIDEAFGASATYWWFVLPAVGAVVGCGLTLVVLFVIRKRKKAAKE